MFEDYSILILISIIIGSLGIITPGIILAFRCLRRKLKFTDKDLNDALLSFKYYSMQNDYSDDIELMDEDVVMQLDKDAGIGKYEDTGSRTKKMKEAAKRTKSRVDLLSIKKKRSKIICVIEAFIVAVHNIGVVGVLIAGLVVVARAQYVGDKSDFIPNGAEYAVTIADVDYYTLACDKAADLGLCNLTQSSLRYSYEVKGFKVRSNENCKIGGDTSETWAEQCKADPMCSYKREDTRCDDYCFGGYDSITRVDLDVEITPINVIFAYSCNSLFKKSTLNCPYGFIEKNSNYYCLNNDGSINDHWFILEDKDDSKFHSLYKFPEIKVCEPDYTYTYRTTTEHVDPNQCRLYYGKKSDGSKKVNECTELKPVPINTTHVILQCDTECVVETGENWEFPCGTIVPMDSMKFQNCMYVPTGGSKYSSACTQFNPASQNGTAPDIYIVPKEQTENGKPMTSFQKVPRYIWLCGLILAQCLILGLEVWMF